MKLSRSNLIKILIGVVIVILAIVVIKVISNRNTINLADYISVNYYGANGYATAECSVDTDKLYQRIAGKEKDTAKLTNLRKLADSVEAAVAKSNISNGSVVQVETTYDESAANASGYKIHNAKYNVRASGINAGTKIDLYEHVVVTFAGISPEAYVVINNQWEDDYLKTLSFTADKYSPITKDDTITLSCSASWEEIASHGYIVDKLQAEYPADQLSTYAESVDDIDRSELNTIKELVVKTITDETTSKSFRMLYKATKDTDYLYQENDENASNIESLGEYFLTKKSEDQPGLDNYLYTFYQADISNSSTDMKVYFAFEFTQGYIENNGSFHISYDKPEDKYTCYTSYDKMYQGLVEKKASDYDINKLN